MNNLNQRIIYSSRWVLYPFNIGLYIALILYLYKYGIDIYNLILTIPNTNTEDLRVLILGLVDTAMVANLLVMIIQGSYQIFIQKLHVDKECPQWLDHIDSGVLKVKVALSIAGITLIQILKDFVNIEHIEWMDAKRRIYIHLVCLVSALIMAIIWRITHDSPTSLHTLQEEKHA